MRPIVCILVLRDDRLTGFTTQLRGNRGAKSSIARTMAVLCLALLALLVVVQVAHFHASETIADHCPLCVSMHSAAPVAETAAAIVLVQIGVSTPISEARSVVRNWNPKLFTRPPPAGC